MITLRACSKLLAEGITQAAMQRALAGLRRDLPAAEHLCAVALHRTGMRVVAIKNGRAWDVESGQRSLFDSGERTPVGDRNEIDAEIGAILRQQELSAGVAQHVLAAAREWFELGVSLEEQSPLRAYETYLRVLACDPEHVEAMINVGRLCASTGDQNRAAAYFRQAIRADPAQPVAHFNLGVTLQDIGNVDGAVEAYRAALIHDPQFADAHYNLSSLLEQQGDRRGALQHMAAYRVASEPPPS